MLILAANLGDVVGRGGGVRGSCGCGGRGGGVAGGRIGVRHVPCGSGGGTMSCCSSGVPRLGSLFSPFVG